MFLTLEDFLFAYSISIAVLLGISAAVLVRKRLFKWTTTGFWSWAAFLTYFFLNPITSIKWNISHYKIYLQLSNGLLRGEWIGFVSIVGIMVFFIAYLVTRCHPIRWNLKTDSSKTPFLMALFMFVILTAASFSLITYRTRAAFRSPDLSIVGGRFTGMTTGYEYVGHMLIFIPIALLLLSKSNFLRFLGFMMSGAYVFFSMPDPWSRFSIVSMLILVSLAVTIRKKRNWPSFYLVVLIVLIMGVLILRGHKSLNTKAELYNLVVQLPNQIGPVLSSVDTAMLPSWFLQSYVKDEITGYDYGLPLINYMVSGFFPSRLLSHKYFLIDWLRSKQPFLIDWSIIVRLNGAKSSLLGSFYSNGGIIAVILEMWIMGVLCRKMDGMLLEETPPLVKATGICWTSILWILWGSSDYWGFTLIGTLSLPTLLLWLFAPKETSRSVQTRSVKEIRC